MLWLKQSTAVDIGMGPFLDSADGNTVEGALTITQPDIRLKKNGGAWAQKNAAQTLSHEENGWYEVSLDATDTDTLGILIVAIHEGGALPVWEKFMVVPANVYDSLISGSDKLQVHADEITAGLITSAALADNAITAAKINADAITVDKIAPGAIVKGDQLTGLNDLSAANVNAEVVDALNTDTYAEPGQGAPPATATLVQKIGYLYKAFRNKITSTDSQISLFNDAGDTVDQKAGHSDNGTTYQRDEFVSGP